MPPRPNSDQQRAAVWREPRSYTLTLLALFLDTYGTEGLTWDPATIAAEIEADFNVALDALCFDRLLVGIQLLTTDNFYKSLPDFINFCNVLSGTTIHAELWDPADALEIAWGVIEAMVISPPDANDEEPFTEEIRAYIGHALDAEGIANPPDILRLAIRDRDHGAHIQAAFSDDPVMFQAIDGFERDKRDDITRQLRRNLATLALQLEQLPLYDGQTTDLIKLLSNATLAA